jgi:hypothetical protein
MKMSGFFSNLARTFSDEIKAYTSSHPVRGAAAGQLHAPGYEEHGAQACPQPSPHPAARRLTVLYVRSCRARRACTAARACGSTHSLK